MTVPMSCPAPAADTSSVPRKRRRRAPASGASDDCFACVKRNTKCDRRRPYCSQCLEFGKECSGYKTQLTWGVGVASRGKLRGLSLPVAKSAPAMQSPPVKPRSGSTASRASLSRRSADLSDDDAVHVKLEGQSFLPSSYTQYDFINMVPNSPSSSMSVPAMGGDWTLTTLQEMRSSYNGTPEPSHQQPLRQSLHRLHTLHLSHGEDMNIPSSAGSISGYSDDGYDSPMQQSFNTEDVTYMNSPIPIHSSYSSYGSPADHSTSYVVQDTRGPTSCPDHFYPQSEVSSSLSSHPTIFEMSESRQIAASPAGHRSDIYDDDVSGAMSTSHESDIFMSSSHTSAMSWNSRHDDDYTPATTASSSVHLMSVPESVQYPLNSDISPRLSFFLNYYDTVLCPIFVAIDSSSNPYRSHILSLAVESPSLQHAICALAACNIRMKRRASGALVVPQDPWNQPLEFDFHESRLNGTSSFHLTSNVRGSTDFATNSADPHASDAALQEEFSHRSAAVSLLNAQLSDPALARHDAVLATLLILCHYRMCESGIAQFKTQFAGVKKLLGMRSSGIETGKWGWMESLFTFFDAITASVNDREAQLRGGYLDMIAAPATPEHALENLAGVDGVLFKTIATLGRLNLLSQHRPVLDPLRPATTPSHIPTAVPSSGLTGQALADFYSAYAPSFDGNGFANLLGTHPVIPEEGDDARPLFWAEWTTTRSQLTGWSFSPPMLALPTPLSGSQLRAFASVSEAFRYAALLYTERLAYPASVLPSSSNVIQSLVERILWFVKGVAENNSGSGFGTIGGGSGRMEGFCLWPLFLAGSEAVDARQREEVRGRLSVMGRRNGYANSSAAMTVLEQVWEKGATGKGMIMDDGPFAWKACMAGVEGEFIIV